MIRNEVKVSLNKIEDYLFNNQEHGFWIDFTACHGGSPFWVTGYVGRHLAQNPENLEKLSYVKDRIKFNQRRDGGWGYNHTAVSDSDTTSNCLLFLLNFPDAKNLIDDGLDFLLAHYDKLNGGFSTYTQDNLKLYARDSNIDGWCFPNIETTSLVTRILFNVGYKGGEIEKSLEFITSKQNKNGSWQSYWWTSEEYPIIESVKTLKEFPQYKENVGKALKYLINKEKGFSWENNFTKQYSPFSSAITLNLLLDQEDLISEEYIQKLLETQNEDGSFGPEFIFRIPRYNIIDTSIVEKWHIETPHKNSVYRDNNRLFTTATVYSTLLKYLKYLGS